MTVRQVDVWYDEIYVGFDTLMDFMCPIVERRGVQTWETKQRGWEPVEVYGYDTDASGNTVPYDGVAQYTPMMR